MDGRQDVAATIDRLLADWDGDQPPSDWVNRTIPQFLEAMGAWLGSYENAWRNRDQEPPKDGWVIFRNALEAGARYE
jgi:hypothetical protein